MPPGMSVRKITCCPCASTGMSTRATTQRLSRDMKHLGRLDVESSSTGVQFSSGVQTVEIQKGIEDEEVTPLGFAAPDRVVRKQDDVPFVERDVDHRGVLGNFAAVFDQTRHEQLA